MSEICERGFNSDVQKIRNFGSPVGIIGTPSFRKNWSLKIRNNWSAPYKRHQSIKNNMRQKPNNSHSFLHLNNSTAIRPI